MNFRTAAPLILGLLLAARAEATPVAVTNGNIVIGINDITVDGSDYNASFVDGTCASIFGGCTAAAFGPFAGLNANDHTAATAATYALEDAMISLGLTDPSVIAGCGGTTCYLETPYAAKANGPATILFSVDELAYGYSDPLFTVLPKNYNSTANDTVAYVQWQQVATATPEPASLALFTAAVGAGALTLTRRRRTA